METYVEVVRKNDGKRGQVGVAVGQAESLGKREIPTSAGVG
jgi:hypothetical protein